MKTEELLRYEAEFQAMREALGNVLLVFDFPASWPTVGPASSGSTSAPYPEPSLSAASTALPTAPTSGLPLP